MFQCFLVVHWGKLVEAGQFFWGGHVQNINFHTVAMS